MADDKKVILSMVGVSKIYPPQKQVLKNIYHARKTHKIFEWHTFCSWCEELPYFKEICIDPCVKEVTE